MVVMASFIFSSCLPGKVGKRKMGKWGNKEVKNV
jgi:hypothetical protein